MLRHTFRWLSSEAMKKGAVGGGVASNPNAAAGRVSEGKSACTASVLEDCKRQLYRLAQVNPASARSMIEELKGRWAPSLHLYNVILKGQVLMRDVEGIKATLTETVSSGFAFNAVTVNLLLAYYRDIGRMDEAERLFEALQQQGKVQSGPGGMLNCPGPNVAAYTTMITGWARQGDYDMAVQYFNRMETEGGLRADEAALNAMVAAALDAGDAGTVRRLVGKLEGTSVASGKSLLRAYLKGLVGLKGDARKRAVEAVRGHVELSEVLRWCSGEMGERGLGVMRALVRDDPGIPSGSLHAWVVASDSVGGGCLVPFIALLERSAEVFGVVGRRLLYRLQEGGGGDAGVDGVVEMLRGKLNARI